MTLLKNINVNFSIAIIIGFFMPWATFWGQGASGYDLSKSADLLWLIPAGAALVIALAIHESSTRLMSFIAGATPFAIGAHYLIEANKAISQFGMKMEPSQLFDTMSAGAYVILVFASLLVLSGIGIISSAGTMSGAKKELSSFSDAISDIAEDDLK